MGSTSREGLYYSPSRLEFVCEFVCEPFQVNKPHGIVFFSDEEKNLIDLEVQKMLQKGAIRRVSFDPRQFISNLFITPKKCGDLRTVINLKPLIEFVQYHYFKMEGLNTLSVGPLSGSESFTTIDLKDAYFSIPINRGHYKYLRFEWNSTLFELISFVCPSGFIRLQEFSPRSGVEAFCCVNS